MRYVVALGVALVLNAGANLLVKMGMNSVQASGGLFREGVVAAAGTVLSNGALMIGLSCFALNAVFYMYALESKTLKISIAYPVMVGGGFALIALVARLHPELSERLSWGQIVGVAMVLLGVGLIASDTQTAPG